MRDRFVAFRRGSTFAEASVDTVGDPALQPNRRRQGSVRAVRVRRTRGVAAANAEAQQDCAPTMGEDERDSSRDPEKVKDRRERLDLHRNWKLDGLWTGCTGYGARYRSVGLRRVKDNAAYIEPTALGDRRPPSNLRKRKKEERDRIYIQTSSIFHLLPDASGASGWIFWRGGFGGWGVFSSVRLTELRRRT